MRKLLLGVAFSGLLAAILLPNVIRFIGRGESETATTELQIIQTAVNAMMVDNQLGTLPRPETSATNDMSAFPDTSRCSIDKETDPNGNLYVQGKDKDGHILFQHDIIGDGEQKNLVNYVATQFTKGTYYVDSRGKVFQKTTGYE